MAPKSSLGEGGNTHFAFPGMGKPSSGGRPVSAMNDAPLRVTPLPVSEPCLSVLPGEWLERIAAAAGVPVAALSTVELSPGSKDIYLAALEYAALHPEHPVLTPGPRPLWNCPNAVYEDGGSDSDSDLDGDNGDRSDDDDDDHHDRFERDPCGLKKLRVRRPRYMFGLGSTAVTWPPPPHLEASVLAKKAAHNTSRLQAADADAVRDSRKVEKPSKSADKLDAGPVNANAKDHSLEAMEEERRKGALSELETSLWEDGDSMEGHTEQTTFYYLHFTRGEPMPLEYVPVPALTQFRTLVVASACGSDALRAFIAGVLKWKDEKENFPGRPGRFALYRYKTDGNGCGRWAAEGFKRARPPSSVILPPGKLDGIMDDVSSFLERGTKAWYIDHGLPHRRAYLFYGPPGVGKTSTIRAIASVHKLNCCFLSVTNRDFNNQNLCDALSTLPPRALVVLEDVDALFNEDRRNEQGGHLTFSGMLNALDGLSSADGVITVLTTNHIDRLDSALIRGGRVDRRFEFCRPTQSQIADFFLTFYPDGPAKLAARFASAVMAGPKGHEARSIATLQQHFINQRRSTAEECVDALAGFFESHFPSGLESKDRGLYA